ncbi:MAG TPA: hypothetical protein VJB57_04280 [Dehalococcoidia bacterium]|nr:hypothetical protein [Dehalococcoidia bacterium]
MFKLFGAPVVFVAVVVSVIAAATCGSDDGASKRVELDLTAIRELASAASQDADNMERHAATMTAVAAARPEHAHWASDAEIARANARSLRFVADSARAIDRDQAAFPVTASAVQLDRLLGDGLNLQSLGQTIVDHATAMEGHIDVMRQQAAGDATLLGAIGDLGQDVQGMKSDGTAAMNAGKALADKARTIARSIGVKLD